MFGFGTGFSDSKMRYSTLYSVIFLLNTSLAFQSTIPAIDGFLVGMTTIDPVHRLDAREELEIGEGNMFHDTGIIAH